MSVIKNLKILLCVGFLLSFSLSVFAQKNVTINVKGVSLDFFFQELRKQTGLEFVYSEAQAKSLQPVTMSVEKEPLENVLKKLLAHSNYSYSLRDNAVLIIANPTKATVSSTSENKQQRIEGIVVNSKGEAIAGATIRAIGSDDLTTASNDGAFSVVLPSSRQLQVSTVGYETQTVHLSNIQTTVRVVLKESKNDLDEVMVNAGYYTVKDRERTGSIARVTAKDIENQPVNNILSALQGRMPGVEIIQDSGTSGGGFQIKIRGQNSLRSDANQPLFIIDGIPFSSDPIGDKTTSGNRPSFTSPLSTINPVDIESVEVLKDADATAIYGSRGANGVVLITTKQGKSDATQVNVRTSMGLGKITRPLKLMNTEQYLAMRREAYSNDGITTYPSNAYDINGTWDQNRNTDWQKELIGGTAALTTLQTSLRGGSSTIKYTLNGTHQEETTVYPGAFKYVKNAAHLAVNYKNEKFNFLFTGSYGNQDNNQPSIDLTTIARELAPNAPAVYDEEGKLNWANNTWKNPLANLESKFLSKIDNLNTSMVLSYDLFSELTFKANMGFTQLHSHELRTFPSTMYNPSSGQGSESSSVESNQTNRTSWILEPQLSWDKNWNQHRFSALIGSTFQDQSTDRLYLTAGDFPSNEMLMSLSTAALQLIGLDEKIKYRYQAFYGRLNYILNDRYIFNVTARRDGSSRFSPENRFSNFGAVGASWLFSKEEFFNNNSWLSFGKLRGSYGITGSDNIGDYQFLNNYKSTSNPYNGTVGLSPMRLYNPNYHWELNHKLEVALEAGFFNDLLSLSAAFYQNRSGNQLVGIVLPSTTGFPSFSGNLPATVENKGMEFTIGTKNMESKSWKWTTDFNISFNRNKLLSFPNLESSTYSNTYVLGKSINIIKLYQYTGLNAVNNQYEFYDYDRDGNITSLKDKVIVTDLNPSYFGGIANQISYKQFSLNVLFQFVKQKRQLYLPVAIGGAMMNQLVDYGIPLQPYSTKNTQISANYNLMRSSTLSIVDASYIRLKNISLEYDVPLKSHFLRPQIFLQGQNLFTITPYKGGDPEFKYGGYLPPLRMVVLGVSLNF